MRYACTHHLSYFSEMPSLASLLERYSLRELQCMCSRWSAEYLSSTSEDLLSL